MSAKTICRDCNQEENESPSPTLSKYCTRKPVPPPSQLHLSPLEALVCSSLPLPPLHHRHLPQVMRQLQARSQLQRPRRDLRPPPALLLPMPPVTPFHEPFLRRYHLPQIPKPSPLHELLLASPQIPVLGVLSHSGASPTGNPSPLLSQQPASDALALPSSARKGLLGESVFLFRGHITSMIAQPCASSAQCSPLPPPALFLPKPPMAPPHRLFVLYHPPQIPKVRQL
ncbi:hypothetical protein CY34DRAFT_18541 [Suillus luteus UH-Slu-Lm8-n1]|uniref:Uncharacterized protein n=1 Tax=Suillus luteus UH-Slu-Lm8-n1 TaxID=930992 RepID=A0A0D0AG12_9AGAM|nr:hypothetical protein CY34DRAFT_18541 [Suillus luteus UH-Slu-Lm8-n1]